MTELDNNEIMMEIESCFRNALQYHRNKNATLPDEGKTVPEIVIIILCELQCNLMIARVLIDSCLKQLKGFFYVCLLVS